MNGKSVMKRATLIPLTAAVALALAACSGNGDQSPQATPANMAMTTPAATAQLPPGQQPLANDAATQQPPQGQQAAAPAAQPQFAKVVAVEPVKHTTTTSTPREVCEDQQVAVPETYKDKNQIGGAVVGGVVGGLLGNQIGGGKGKKLATVGGAAAGALAGHEIQKRHQQNNATHMETQRVCHTVTDKSSSTKTVGYDVTYTLNGKQGHIRMDHNPGVGTGLPVQNGVVVASGQQDGQYR